jgi:hypothetical protein
MLTAIQFHRQPLLKADEIHNIRRKGMLPTELESAQGAIFHAGPQSHFGVGE